MIAAWMLYSVVVGVLIAIAALAAEQCCRVLRLPRRAVWVLAVTGTVLLSANALLRASRSGQTTSSPTALALSGTPVSGSTGSGSALADLVARAASARAALTQALDGGYRFAASGVEGLAGSRVLLAAMAVSTSLALALLALTLLRLARARRSWLQHRIGGTPVLLSEDFGPAVIGLLRSAIVVPKWLLGEPAEAQQVIVQHEEEHRQAHDPLVLAATSLGTCLLAWNVALWWMLARLRLAVELDCDDRILRRGVTPLSYGTLLLEIAGRTPPRLFGVTALTDSRIHLERRLLAMTDTNRKPGRARPLLGAAGAVLLAAAACGTEVPTSAAIEELDAAQAQKAAEQSGLIATKATGETPLFVVDGKVVTEAEAREVAPEDIAAIEVLKDAAAVREYGDGARNGVIRMKKRSADIAQASAVERAVLARELQEPTRAQAKKKAVEEAAADEKVARTVAAAEQKVVVARARTVEEAKLAAAKEKQEVMVAKARTVEGAKLAAVEEQQEVLVAKARTVEGAKLAAVEEKAVIAKTEAAKASTADGPKLKAPAAIELRKRQFEDAADAKAGAGEQLPMRKVNPFIIIDGDVSQSVTLPTLAPAEIESVTVLKGDAAVLRFGPRAAGGAIVITTKKGARK